MRYDQSYGIVPLKKEGDSWFVFMVQHRSGHWTLPKGHAEGKETALACAKRELFEETHLSVDRLLSERELTESYQFSSRGHVIQKSVVYFVAEVSGQIALQKEELQDGKWVKLEQAGDVATYQQMKILLHTVREILFSLTEEEP
jgi:8-oxo-dGTP pyrophosphatase MutT (NUDIX family)